MDRVEITARAGDQLYLVAENLADRASLSGREHFCIFNSVEVRCAPDETALIAANRWQADFNAKAETYRNSPEGQAAAREAMLRHEAAQKDTDALLRRLPRVLAGQEDHEILRWLCQWNAAADRADIVREEERVLALFEKAGFQVNACTGPEYVEADRRISFLYLVGQGMDGIRRVGTPHGIIHKFAEQWRQRFAPGVERFSDPRYV
jgi:hypothetical protein